MSAEELEPGEPELRDDPEAPEPGGLRGPLIALFLIANALVWAVVLEPRVLQVPLILLGPDDWRASSIRALDGDKASTLPLLLSSMQDGNRQVAEQARRRLVENPSPLRFLPPDSPRLPALQRRAAAGLVSQDVAEREFAVKLAVALGPLAGVAVHDKAATELMAMLRGEFSSLTELELRRVLAAGEASGLEALLRAVAGASVGQVRALTTPDGDPFVARQLAAFDRLIASELRAHRMMAYQLVGAMRPSNGGLAADLKAGLAIPDARVEALRAALEQDLAAGDEDLRVAARFAADMLIAMQRLEPAELAGPDARRPGSRPGIEPPAAGQTESSPVDRPQSADEERIR